MSKISQLIRTWTKGSVRTSKELLELGYTPQIMKIYENSGWVTLFSKGAYKLAGDTINWEGGVFCIQKTEGSKLHLGGKSALVYRGLSHFLSFRRESPELFYGYDERLPKWFTAHAWEPELLLFRTKIFDYEIKSSLSGIAVNSLTIQCSSPELAILEVLYNVPGIHSFYDADLLMESLTTLRPELLQKLLNTCTSVKVKRLFFYLAEKHNYPWFEELKHSKHNLGYGKRVIEKNGKFDKKYNITVPAHVDGNTIL